MTSPYIEHERERVYFVPVLRQRLSFAVLVRKALAALAPWSDRDLIAVALPPSVLTSIRATLTENPKKVLPVSLVLADWGDSQYREVFPITPCDGIIEAIRFATERRLPVEAIDREIKPGNLVQRRCVRNPDWPDDDLALRWGPEKYLGLVADEIAQPPTRFEPIDTWREIFMAARIQALLPKYHRILVICEAVHLSAVRNHLRAPCKQFPDDLMSGSPRLRVLRANAQVALQYLDDFPKLVELYENARTAGSAAEFDKSTSLLHAVRANKNANILGTRRFQSFHRFLLQLLEKAHRISPRPYEVEQAARSCFGTAATQEIVHKLGEYSQQIVLERIGEILPDQTPVYEVKESEARPEGRFVGRSCNMTRPQYTIRPHHPPWKGSRPMSDSAWVTVPESLRRQLRQKVVSLATHPEYRTRSMPFRGALEAGVDGRRTMRSMLSSSPRLFVKEITRRRKPKDYANEPIVWILSSVVKAGYALECVVVGDKSDDESGTRYPQSSGYVGPGKEVFRSDDGLISFLEIERLGFLSFFDYNDLKDVRKAFGASFEGRMLNHEDLMRKPYGTDCVLHEFDWLLTNQVPWWEILILTALRVAAEVVICVVPDGFRLPQRVITEARKRGKQITCVRVTSFSRLERARLGKLFQVKAPHGALKEKAFNTRVFQLAFKLGIEI